MVQFSIGAAEYGMTKNLPGKGRLGSARSSGGNQKYQWGDGPSGSGGGSTSAGPNGTTSGPAGTRIKGFTGSPPGSSGMKDWKKVRDRSNPEKK